MSQTITEIHFLLTLRGPLMLSIPGGDPNSNATLNHIPGSVVRGALAGRYMAQKGATETELTRHFLQEQTLFLPAYPLLEGQLTRPTPRSWQYQKDGTKELVNQHITSQPEATKVAAEKYPFTTPRATLGTLAELPSPPATQVAVHTARDRNMGRATEGSGALFQYEALVEGQQFVGRIRVLGDTAVFWQTFLKKVPHLLMGGSQTAGYGLVALSHLNATQLPLSPVPTDKSFTLYLLSDTIIRHPKTGQNGSYLEAYLQEKLGDDQLKLTQAYAQTSWRGGFNNKWGLPLPQTWVYTAGSVWQVTTGTVPDPARLTDLLLQGLGERRTEGFGQCLLNPTWESWPLPAWAAEGEAYLTTAVEPATPLSKEAQALISRVKGQIQSDKLEPFLLTTAHRLAEKFGHQPANSQISQLRLLLRDGLATNSLQDLVKHLDGTKSRAKVDEQYRKARFRTSRLPEIYNFRDWLTALANKPALVWQELDVQKSSADLVDIFYAARLMALVCEQISRGRRQKAQTPQGDTNQ